MCEIPLSCSLTRNTKKCNPRKILSVLTLDTRGKHDLGRGGNCISLFQGYLYCLEKSFQQSIIPTWYLFKNTPLLFYTQLLNTCLTLVMTHAIDSWKIRLFFFAKILTRKRYSCPSIEWKASGSTVVIIESLFLIIIYQLWNLIEIFKYAIKWPHGVSMSVGITVQILTCSGLKCKSLTTADGISILTSKILLILWRLPWTRLAS